MTHPEIDPSAESLHELMQRLQHKYRQKRRRWAWSIGRPYSSDIDKPDPGSLDLAAEDDG